MEQIRRRYRLVSEATLLQRVHKAVHQGEQRENEAIGNCKSNWADGKKSPTDHPRRKGRGSGGVGKGQYLWLDFYVNVFTLTNGTQLIEIDLILATPFAWPKNRPPKRGAHSFYFHIF